jgi:hypothetical protein
MKMKDIYPRYFQKSATFLYPLLGIKKNKYPKPRQTYVSWGEHVKVEDKLLVCLYDTEDTDEWKRFEANVLMTHPMLVEGVVISDDQIIYIFDFNLPEVSEDFDNFIKGRYSKFSNQNKKTITDYYGIQTPEWVYIESYIHPHKYFKLYANLLKVDEDSVRYSGELCDKYNSEKENCSVIINELTNAKI